MRLLILFFFLNTACFGQVVLLDKVYELVSKREYEKAAQAILIAETNVATANDARTYYLKAFINKELFQHSSDEREKFRALAFQSLAKCSQLDHTNSFSIPVKQLEDYLLASLYNDGTSAFNEKRYRDCITYLQKYNSLSHDRDDFWRDAQYYLGVSYQEILARDSAIHFYEVAMNHHASHPDLFVELGYLYLEKEEGQKSLTIVSRGLNKYPEHFDLQLAELNILSFLQSYQVLEEKIELFNGRYPNNVDALLMAGTVYSRLRDVTSNAQYFYKSEEVYNKVLSIDPLHIDANYNLGVLYYNEAVDIIDKNDFDTDITELTKLLERSATFFQKALPLLRRIFHQQTRNLKILLALQAIYYNLNMKDELSEINVLIKDLQ